MNCYVNIGFEKFIKGGGCKGSFRSCCGYYKGDVRKLSSFYIGFRVFGRRV